MPHLAAQSATSGSLMRPALIAGEGDLVAIPVALESAPKAMSASEDMAEADEPAGSQVQSGESGSLPQVRPIWNSYTVQPASNRKAAGRKTGMSLCRASNCLTKKWQAQWSVHQQLSRLGAVAATCQRARWQQAKQQASSSVWVMGMRRAQAKTEQTLAKDRGVTEWSKAQLLRLEDSLAAMEKQIGSTHPHVSALSVTGLPHVSSISCLACRAAVWAACCHCHVSKLRNAMSGRQCQLCRDSYRYTQNAARARVHLVTRDTPTQCDCCWDQSSWV